MNWFYALNGQQAGPVDEAELERLAGVGTITPATLVWRSGMTQWQPYSEAHRPVPPVDPAAATAATTAAAAANTGTAIPTAAQAQCSQCGRVLPAAKIVRVDGRNVCGDCQPLLPQRPREAAPIYQPTFSLPFYAGFGIRFGAACLDGIILLPVCFGLWIAMWFLMDLPTMMTTSGASQPDDMAHLTRAMLPFNLGLQFLLASYSAFCLNRFGGTPGKRICNLRVVHGTDGGRVTFLRGLGRYAAKMVPRILPGILWVGPLSLALLWLAMVAYIFVDAICIVFDPETRSLHDRICDTRVVAEAPVR